MAGKCGICLKPLLTKHVKLQCDECKFEFHAQCCKMSKVDVDCLVSEGLPWRCNPCAAERRKSMVFESQAQSGNLTLEDIMSILREIKAEMRETIKEFNSSYEVLNEKLEANTELLKKQSEELRSYIDETTRLREENCVLKKKIIDLEVRLEDSEQYSRGNCLELHGIPEEPNECVIDIVKNIGQALELNINDSMVDNCHRLGKRGDASGPAGIIVKFVRKLDAEEVLRKRRIKRNLSTSHLGLSLDRPVYINESLCPARRRLYSLARAAKREKGYKYLWLRNGKIFLRKEENAPICYIKSQTDLDKL